MPAIGNDVVDLQEALATNKSQDHRFLHRVFTDAEKNSILTSDSPEIRLWLYWAAKETAYKMISQLESPPIFSHKQFMVSVKNSKLMVSYKDHIFLLSYDINSDFIHCYGASSDIEAVNIAAVPKTFEYKHKFTSRELRSIQSIASAVIRYDIKQYLAKKLNISYSDIEIIRESIQGKSQPPYLLINDKKSTVSMSLSHHGRWYAWVLLPIPIEQIDSIFD